MRELKNFVKLGDIDVSQIPLGALTFGEETWRETIRGTPHGDTQTMYLRMPEKRDLHTLFNSLEVAWALGRGVPMPLYNVVGRVSDIVHLAGDDADDGPGYVPQRRLGRVMIVKLKHYGLVGAHVDTGAYAEATDRFHVPLQTGPGATFYCGDESVNMGVGEVWWFDKHQDHEVYNGSPQNRIHLIVDMFK